MISISLSHLGCAATDKVTGFTGMASSVVFDCYGCIQVFVTPRAVDNKPQDGNWYDLKRLEFGKRILPAPAFVGLPGSEPGGESHPAPPSGPR